jgi:hypothetical protein
MKRAKQKRSNMDMKQYSAKNYLKLDDLVDGPLVKTITSIEEGSYDKPEATFDDGSKLGLNKSSVLALSKVLGFDSADWIGVRVEILAGEVTHKGNIKPAVLVKPIDAPAKRRPADDLNDAIEF